MVAMIIGGIGVTLVFSCIIGLVLYAAKSKKEIHYLKQTRDDLEHLLKEQRNQFDVLFSNSAVATAAIDLSGNIIRINNAFTALLDYSEHELLSMNYFHLLNAGNWEDLQTHLHEMKVDNKIFKCQREYQCNKKNGEKVWVSAVLIILRNEADIPINYLVQLEDITLRKMAEEQLQKMAYHDPLTGLANRNKLEQYVNQLIQTTERQQTGFALLFLDLDHFKTVNDSIGHDAGDNLLQIISERLRVSIRANDLVTRLGGDEFIILLSSMKHVDDVAQIAAKVLESIMQPIVVKNQALYLTTSIGISLYPFDGQNMQTLLKNADLALYSAKEHGRNNYQFYVTEMSTKAEEKLTLQNAVGYALANNEFILHYQPKMNLVSKKITGLEAFIRWNSEEYGEISAEKIINLAEENGLIIPLGHWILNTACSQLKNWHHQGFTSMTMAINCSNQQIKQNHFVDEVLSILDYYQLAPQMLEIEITERTLMEGHNHILPVLHALKKQGIQIVIDDFGTGYWSLANLRKLSVDKIKIDQTYTKQITKDDTSEAIITAIIAMANKLEICSVAEGVETQVEHDFLQREGCTEIQGYYLSKPIPQESVVTFLHDYATRARIE